MKNLFRHSASLICLLAVSACASSPPPPTILVKPARLQVPPLQPWIREPAILPISPQQLQAVLNGSASSTTKP